MPRPVCITRAGAYTNCACGVTTWVLLAGDRGGAGGACVLLLPLRRSWPGNLVTLDAASGGYMTHRDPDRTTFLFGGLHAGKVCKSICVPGRVISRDDGHLNTTRSYRDWRGEPRGKGYILRKRERAAAAARPRPESPQQGRGPRATATHTPTGRAAACPPFCPTFRPQTPKGIASNCHGLRHVCPVGIDIRNGQQMGVITCACASNACDESGWQDWQAARI